jgi:hypothetical protein
MSHGCLQSERSRLVDHGLRPTAAAERLGELIARREQLIGELSEIAVEMTTCEAKIKAFD